MTPVTDVAGYPSFVLETVLGEIPAGCGAVGLLSGDEFLPSVRDFDHALLKATGRRVALLLAADPRAARTSARLATKHYRALDAEAIVVNALHREEMTAAALPDYDVLFIAGGDPRRLIDAVEGTELWAEALRRWRAGRGLAGASAGAMALCEHSLAPQPGDRVPRHWRVGLGPVSGFALAVHASSRSRRWLESVAADAPCPLVALDDETGVLLSPGAPPRVHGPGRVWVVQASGMPPAGTPPGGGPSWST